MMDELLMKNNDRSNLKKRKSSRKDNQFSNKLDKVLLDHKMLADDLEKYCMNKRLKKNAYKLDLLHC